MHDKSALLKMRKSLGLTREELLRRCKDISIGTIRNAEKGFGLRKRSAEQILEAINSVLRDRKKPEITLDDLKLQTS